MNEQPFVLIGEVAGDQAFTEEQHLAATTNKPSLQNITMGKCQFWGYSAAQWGYSYDDVRIYNTKLTRNQLDQICFGGEQGSVGEVCLHSETELTVTEEPTCSKEGVGKLVCKKCGAVLSENEVVPKTAHTPGSWIEVPSSGEETGYRHKVCTVCGQDAVWEIIPPPVESKNSEFGDGKNTTETGTGIGASNNSVPFSDITTDEQKEAKKGFRSVIGDPGATYFIVIILLCGTAAGLKKI